MVAPTWSPGAIIWGDKTQQASAFADDPNPHTNPQAADIDWNTFANDYNGHVHDGVGTPLISALYTNTTPQSMLVDAWQINDVTATPRFQIQSTSPHIQTLGNFLATGTAAVGNLNPTATAAMRIYPPTGTTGSFDWITMPNIASYLTSGNTNIIRALNVGFLVQPASGSTGHTFQGLAFQPFYRDDGGFTEITSVFAGGQGVHVGSGVVTARTLLKAGGESLTGAVNITTLRGLWLTGWNSTVAVYGSGAGGVIGIDVDKIVATSGGVKILMRLTGPTTSNFRVDGTDPTNLGSTTNAQAGVLMAFNENGTVTLRTVQWKQQSTLASTDKVLIGV